MTASKFTGSGNSSPSMMARIGAPPEGVLYDKWYFIVRSPLASWIWMYWLVFFSTRSPSQNSQGRTFFSKAFLSPLWYSWLWQIAAKRFSSMSFSLLNLVWIYYASSSLASMITLIEGILTSIWKTTFMPYTSKNGVSPVEVHTKVL